MSWYPKSSILIKGAAQKQPIRIMVMQGSARNENNCPDRMGKSRAFAAHAVASLPDYVDVDFFDFSVDDNKPNVQPCKACVSTSAFHCHYPCLPASERVQTEYGFKSIADIEVGEAVSTGLVTNAWMSSPEEDIYEVVLSDGRRVRATSNHKIKVLTKDRFRDRENNWKYYRKEEWKEVGDLVCGDLIPFVLGGKFPEGSDQHDDNLYLLAGLIWGDGSFVGNNKEAVVFYYDSGSPLLAGAICDSLDVISDNIHNSGNSALVVKTSKEYRCINTKADMRYLYFGYDIGRIIKYDLKIDKEGKAKDRRLPESIFSWSEKQVANFMNGWFSTDGHIYRNSICLTNASYDCLRDAQLLLQKMGIRSYISNNNHLTTIVRDKKITRASVLSISLTESIKIFKEKIGLLDPCKNDKLNEIKIDKRKNSGRPSFVKDVKRVGREPVYDIEVLPSHEFVAEGVVVHNCDCYSKNDSERPDKLHDLDFYKRLEAADGFFLIAPINWYSVPSQVKTAFDRLVCVNKTMTTDQADVLMKGDTKNADISRELEKSNQYNHLLKNHYKGKVGAFFIHGDDGAADYKEYAKDPERRRTLDSKPKTMDSLALDMTEAEFDTDPKNSVLPLVYQCRYSGMVVPDELVIGMLCGKGYSYSENDDMFKRHRHLFENINKMANGLVSYIERMKS